MPRMVSVPVQGAPAWVARFACCKPRSAQLLTCSSTDFEQWLANNKLPVYQRRRHSGSASTGPGGDASPPVSRRFHWVEAPSIAAHFLQRHDQWTLEAPGVLVASSGDGSGPPVARLEFPRVMGGMHPDLFASGQQQDELSPLVPRHEAEHQRLLQALACLAQLDGSSAGGSAASGEPSAQHPQPEQPAPQRLRLSIGSQLLVLLSTDSAVIALYSEGQLQRHRVLTGYTVRRQQGKAQVTYARQGGGAHSMGGSIRAHATRRLFQGVGATLAQWREDVAGCSQLFRSGTVRPWNELYASTSPPPPVDRHDPRWQSVGIGVRRPRLADAERVHAALSHGTLEEGSGCSGSGRSIDGSRLLVATRSVSLG